MTSPKLASAERQATLLQAAARAAKSFASILEFDDILDQAVEIICDEFGFYYSGVFMVDASQKWAVLKAGQGKAGKSMLAEGHKLEIGGNSMIGDCIATKTARISLDVGEEAVFFKNPHLPKTRSEMGLPLIVGDQVLGALTVQSDEEAAFTKEDIETLQALADQLAVAIENARSHEKSERRAKYFGAANQVGRNLASILDLDTLLPKTVDVICDAYGFYYAGVFLVDESGQWAVLRAGRGKAGKAMLDAGHKLEIGGNSMIGDCIAAKTARISLDVGEEAVFFKNLHLPDTRSEMGLPLVVGDEVLGAVTVQSAKEADFSQEDISTLQTMADHLAIAIKNAFSLKELEEAHARILRQKTYEALATATTQAIHWIGNKALPITTTVDRMRQDIEKDELDLNSLREDLGMVEMSARQIVDVKENLLGPAREQEPRPVMIADIAAASAAYSHVPVEKLKLDIIKQPLYCSGDSTQLVRVFSNLFTNSLEANASQINVKVSQTPHGNLEISVSDDGDGIPEDMRDKIWAAFVTSKGAAHQGLGLAACLHVIGQHGGSIQMENEGGRGTTFTISLAACDPPQAADHKKRSGTVLLIDDDDPWAEFAANALKEKGMNVMRQSDAKEAQKADLVLLDDSIRSNDVDEILDALEKSEASKKTAILAPAVTVERTTFYLRHNFKDVYLKPYSEAELAEILSQL